MLSSAVHEFGKQRALVLIEENNSAFDAFRKIVEKKVYGLGVVRFPAIHIVFDYYGALGRT